MIDIWHFSYIESSMILIPEKRQMGGQGLVLRKQNGKDQLPDDSHLLRGHDWKRQRRTQDFVQETKVPPQQVIRQQRSSVQRTRAQEQKKTPRQPFRRRYRREVPGRPVPTPDQLQQMFSYCAGAKTLEWILSSSSEFSSLICFVRQTESHRFKPKMSLKEMQKLCEEGVRTWEASLKNGKNNKHPRRYGLTTDPHLFFCFGLQYVARGESYSIQVLILCRRYYGTCYT